MIQSRLENEQFTSLPSLIGTDRSRTGFITTDRPDSSQVLFTQIKEKNKDENNSNCFSLLIYTSILFQNRFGKMFNI